MEQQPNNQSERAHSEEDWIVSGLVTVVIIIAGAMVDFIMFISSL